MFLPLAVSATGGEIAGLPGNLPPLVEQPLEINFSNDFLGRGGSVDDFRTQQLILSTPVAGNWWLTADHSTLTQTDPSSPGRIDQATLSIGYRLVEAITATTRNRVTVGTGLRSTGDFGGENMQNGFHRLIGSKVEALPYEDAAGTDAIAWIDLHHYARLRDSVAGNPDWSLGYWVRGSSLLTTAGEWDNAVGVYGVLGHRNFQGWLGLRRDWRHGYDAPVLRETAAAESDAALVLGMRWGPVVLETVQQFEQDGSYGQLRWIAPLSVTGRANAGERPLAAVATVFQVPDVLFRIDGRYEVTPEWLATEHWAPSLIVSTAFGEPQYRDDPSLFVQTLQLLAGLEWERNLAAMNGRAAAYVSLAAGLRREQLIGDGERIGQQSAAVNRGVVEIGTGARFHAASMGRLWRYRLQIGLVAALPLDDARLAIGGSNVTVQQPSVGVTLGMTFDRHH